MKFNMISEHTQNGPIYCKNLSLRFAFAAHFQPMKHVCRPLHSQIYGLSDAGSIRVALSSLTDEKTKACDAKHLLTSNSRMYSLISVLNIRMGKATARRNLFHVLRLHLIYFFPGSRTDAERIGAWS
jgi:hypothetical protein